MTSHRKNLITAERRSSEEIDNLPWVMRYVDHIWTLLNKNNIKKVGVFAAEVNETTILMKSLHDKALGEFDRVMFVDSEDLGTEDQMGEAILRQLDRTVPSNRNQIKSEVSKELQDKKYLLLLNRVPRKIDLETLGILNIHTKGKVVAATRDENVYRQLGEHDYEWVKCAGESWKILREIVESVEGSTGTSGPEPTPSLDPKLQLILPETVKRTKGNLREVTEKNWKLIMTAASDEVFTKMDARVPVEVLSFEEVWELFYKKVGSVIDLPDIKPYARGIVEQCRVLPLLIIGAGWALAEEKDTKVWACACTEFQFQKQGAQQLKFVYDRLEAYCVKFHGLKTDEIQGCFLYCALLLQDHEVRISELVECWMQEGLIAGDVVVAVKNGHEIVKVLVAAALLEGDEGGLFIRMHKLVWDFALEMLLNGVTHPNSIFKFFQRTSDKSRPIDCYLFKAGGRLVDAPPAEEWDKKKTIFLMDNEFSSLPERPNCRNLSGLFLQRNHRLTAIPLSFFDYMPNLEVLNLSKTGIDFIPASISKLKNLRELIMKDCGQIVKLPSEVGKVRFLEVLDLHGTKIEQLPVKTGELATLQCMRVCFHRPDDDVMSSKSPTTLLSHGFLTRLLSLSSLSIVVVPGDRRWNNLVEDIVRDMRKLRNLAELCFYFPEVRLLQHFLETCPSWKGTVLKKFNFVVGHDVKRMMSRVPYDVEVEYSKRDRCVRFVNSDSETAPEVLSQLLPYATAFYLDHDVKIQSLSDFGNENIAPLEFCVVRECPKVESIFNGEGLAFPLLEQLSVHYAKRLKCIWSGNLRIGSFACLKHLCLRVCGSLEYVMTRSMTQYVSNLEELVVEDCEMMTELVKEDEESGVGECEFRRELEKKDEDKIVMCGHTVLPRLKCLTLHYLPKLSSIWNGPWPALRDISFYNCPNLRNLHIGHNSEIRRSIAKIKAENEWWSRLVWEDASLSKELEACFIPFGEDFP